MQAGLPRFDDLAKIIAGGDEKSFLWELQKNVVVLRDNSASNKSFLQLAHLQVSPIIIINIIYSRGQNFCRFISQVWARVFVPKYKNQFNGYGWAFIRQNCHQS
jgi:hypothetical protein